MDAANATGACFCDASFHALSGGRQDLSLRRWIRIVSEQIQVHLDGIQILTQAVM